MGCERGKAGTSKLSPAMNASIFSGITGTACRISDPGPKWDNKVVGHRKLSPLLSSLTAPVN